MKKLCILILILLSGYTTAEEKGLTSPNSPPITKTKKADFRLALKYVLEHEGYWVNHPSDYGKETYCGVSRVMNPDWSGWKYIDEYKRHHQLRWNDSIPVPILKWMVDSFYLDIWVGEDFFSIQDQQVANYCLDFRVNGTIGSLIINRTLSDMGYNVSKINRIDSSTIKYLNTAPKWELLCKLMNNRLSFYTNIVDKRPKQLIFLNHWIKRVKV